LIQWSDGRSDLATAFAIPDVETPSSRAVSARDSPRRARKLSRSSRAATICPCSPEDDLVRCPRASSGACRGILALALRLESWGTPSELFLSVNNHYVPHYALGTPSRQTTDSSVRPNLALQNSVIRSIIRL